MMLVPRGSIKSVCLTSIKEFLFFLFELLILLCQFLDLVIFVLQNHKVTDTEVVVNLCIDSRVYRTLLSMSYAS